MAVEYPNVVHASARVVYDSDAETISLVASQGFSDVALSGVGHMLLTLTDEISQDERVVLVTPKDLVIMYDDSASLSDINKPRQVRIKSETAAGDPSSSNFDIVVFRLPSEVEPITKAAPTPP